MSEQGCLLGSRGPVGTSQVRTGREGGDGERLEARCWADHSPQGHIREQEG